jgi:hypothetical protein
MADDKPRTDAELIAEHQEHFRDIASAWSKQRQAASDDLRFFIGETQWPAEVRRQREAEGLPCLIINRLPQFVATVVGDERQNRPAIKVSPVDSGADKQTAEILEGLIRNIETISMADVAYDRAFEFPVICGHRGFLRVVAEYAGEDTFHQDLKIKQVLNPFTVFFDPNCQEPDYSDAEYCYVIDDIPKERFEAEYPGHEPCEWESASNADSRKDQSVETVRVVEAYWREPVKRTIVQLLDGRVVAEDDLEGIQAEDPFAIVAEDADGQPIRRVVDSHKILWAKMTGGEVLDGPREYLKGARFIPVIPVAGFELNIEGELHQWGLVRYARDPQQAYNFTRTKEIETIALAPKAPWIGTKRMFEGFEAMWSQANNRSFSYLPYNPDQTAASQKPERVAPPSPNSALTNSSLQAVDEIKSVIGIYDASLGQKSNETSGKAILARQRESDTATFTYLDNLTRAIRLLGKVLIDCIPRVYDSERIVRVLGVDGSERQVMVNRRIGDVVLHDLTVGKYDVTVSAGPSYATQRIEAANSMIQFMQAYPNGAPLIADLVAASMDWPKAEEVAERLNASLPPQIRAAGNPQAMAELQQAQAAQQQQHGPDPRVQAEQLELQARAVAADAEVKKAHMDLQGKAMDVAVKHAKAVQQVASLQSAQPRLPPGVAVTRPTVATKQFENGTMPFMPEPAGPYAG